ncbi:MAG: MFS transporter, partial [Chloroflexi bacterium]
MGTSSRIPHRLAPHRSAPRRHRRGDAHRVLRRGDGHSSRNRSSARAGYVDHVRHRDAHRSSERAERSRRGQRRSPASRLDRRRARARCGGRRIRADHRARARAGYPARGGRRSRARRGDTISLVRLPRIVEPLRHRDFRLLWTGQTLTLLGSFVSNIAFPFQVLQLGGSAFELGAFVSAFTGASLVFLLIGGAVADRVPRRTLIITTELASGVTVGSMAILGFAGALQMWHLYVAAACFGAASAFSVPALGAIIPELVPDEILVAGNAVQGLSRQSARVGGPIVGGLLVATAGPAAAFAFNAVTFFLSAGAVALTRARPLVSEARRSIPGEIREGFAFVFSVQWLWVTIFGWSLIVAAFIGAIAVALPLLVTTVLGGGAVTYGIISAGVGVGEAIGATAIAQVRIRRSGVAMYLLGALMGVSFFIYGLVPTVPGALLASAINGLSFACFGVLWVTALQVHVPRRLLGRVTSVDYFGGTLLAPIAPIGAAFLAQSQGPAFVFIVA